MKPTLQDEILGFIDHWSAKGFSVDNLCQTIGLARSSYYAWKKRQDQPTTPKEVVPRSHWLLDWEKAAIISYAQKHPEEGYKRLCAKMLDDDVVAVSPSSVYRVMKNAGLIRIKEQEPSLKGTGFIQPEKPHEHWHIDFSFLKVRGQFVFMVCVLDGYSRAVLACEIRSSMTTADAQLALQKAREAYPDAGPRIISDNGSAFVCHEFSQYVDLTGMTHVRTSPYYPQSNGKLERWNRSFKVECFRRLVPLTLEDAQRAKDRYVKKYNEKRLHEAIGYVTPMDRLEGRDVIIFAQRKEKLAKAREERQRANEARRAKQEEEARSNFFLSNPALTKKSLDEGEEGQGIPEENGRDPACGKPILRGHSLTFFSASDKLRDQGKERPSVDRKPTITKSLKLSQLSA